MTGPRRLALAALVLAALTPWTAHAAIRHIPQPAAQATFRLQPPAGTSATATFWVSYGPVAGSFGLIRMHRNSQGVFVASARFPSGTRATFYYIEGRGVTSTPAGLAPGNPVRTLGREGPLSVGKQPIPLMRVAPPVG